MSSHDHPFQSFQWADYTAKPKHDCHYTVIPLYGTQKNLKDGDAVSVKVTTESEWGKKRYVLFNRRAVATQEYARRFQNIPPSKLKGDPQKAAYLWLSHGLLFAFTEFVSTAKNDSIGLRSAFCEFQRSKAMKALNVASDAGSDVAIIYDAIPRATRPKAKNEKAILYADIERQWPPARSCTTSSSSSRRTIFLSPSGPALRISRKSASSGIPTAATPSFPAMRFKDRMKKWSNKGRIPGAKVSGRTGMRSLWQRVQAECRVNGSVHLSKSSFCPGPYPQESYNPSL